jgi:hypothetical protein
MPNYKNIETNVKGWATAHLVFAAIIAFAAGFLFGAIIS